jgi:hypothetical protein
MLPNYSPFDIRADSLGAMNYFLQMVLSNQPMDDNSSPLYYAAGAMALIRGWRQINQYQWMLGGSQSPWISPVNDTFGANNNQYWVLLQLFAQRAQGLCPPGAFCR